MNNYNNKKYLEVIIFPFLGLFDTLMNLRKSWAMNAFWIVCIYMSFIHIYAPQGGTFGMGSDIERYVIQLHDMNYGLLSFEEAFKMNVRPDYYQLIVTYLVSRFTSEGHVLFLVFGTIFGYFYSRNIWFVLNRIPYKIPHMTYIFIALYFLACPIWSVGGVRMWTALHVFAYGALPYLMDKDKSKLIFCVLTFFVHFSFLFPVVILLLFFVIPNRLKYSDHILKYSVVFFVITMFFNVLDLQQIGNIIQRFFPSLYESNVEGYLGEEYVETVASHNENHSLFYKTSAFLNSYMISFVLVYLYFAFRNKINKKYIPFLVFTFIFGALANIVASAPSGGRFITLAQMFIMPSVIFALSNLCTHYINIFVKCIIYSFLILIVFKLRTGAECYGINLLIGNFFIALPIETNISFIQTLKMIF